MGFVATVVEFLRTVTDGKQTPEAKVDRGGGDTATGYHFAPAGDDSQPLAGDDAILVADEGTGNAQIVGYQDPASTPKAGAGEKRIYSRSAPGVMAAEVWLKADGTISIASLIGSVEVAPSGAITFTTALGTYGADTHTHLSPFGPTGAPIPNT